MSRRRTLSLLVVVIGSLGAAISHAQDLVIEQGEFASWPDYCQARYVTVPPGNTTPYVRVVPFSKVTSSKQLLGEATFDRVHHYCYGLIWLARARFEQNRATKTFYLGEARDEVMFTFAGLPTDSPMIGPSYVAIAQICIEERKMDCALENLNQAIETQPGDPLAYSALAVVYRSQKKLELARDTLIKGNVATNGRSAEIHYNLALIQLEIGDVDSAVEHAHSAYDLGYPLPGLRNRLQRMGRWDTSTNSADSTGR